MVSDLYYILLILWSITYTIGRHSNYITGSESAGSTANNIVRIVFLSIYILLVIKTVFDFFFIKSKQRLFISLMAVLLVVSYIHIQVDFLYPALLFIMASKNVDIKKALKGVLYAQIVSVLFTIVSARAGIIIDGITAFRDGVNRYSLGFNHPNTIGQCLLTISMLTFYFYYKKRPLQVYFTLIVSFVISYWIASSRTAAALLVVVFICQVFISLNNNGFKYINRLTSWILNNLKFIVPIVIVVNILAATGYVRFGLNDNTFQIRYSLAYNYLQHYKINLFGRNLYFGGDDTRAGRYVNNNLNYSLTVLDNAYIYLLLGFGIVVVLCFFLAYFLRMRMAGLEKDYAIIFVLLVYLLCGFMETALIRFCFNYFILFFADLLWKQKIRTE